MIQPAFVGQGFKSFTDCYTWTGNSTPTLTAVTLNFYPLSSYSFQQNDVAIVAVSNGIYAGGSGWTRIVDGANIDIWIKQHSGGADTFDAVWAHVDGGSSLFYGGIYGMVLRSPYGSSGLYYANNENTYSVGSASYPMYRPAVARSSFEDSDFYYRIDADYASEGYGSYYSCSYGYDVTALGGSCGSSNCANVETFLYSPPATLGLSLFTSSALSGNQMTFYPLTYFAGNSNNCFFSKTTLWVRGFNPSSQGVML